MSDTDDLEVVVELLGMFWEDRDRLGWGPPGRPLRFYVECSDTFYWAMAEGEHIDLPDDLPGLRAAQAEFPDDDWPLLWACRKRGQRPMDLYLTRVLKDADTPFVRAIKAAGPPRQPGDAG